MKKKYAPYIFASIMAVAMGFMMSFCLTLVNTGFSDGFFFRWLKAFGVGICISFPTSLTVAPIAQKIVARVTK